MNSAQKRKDTIAKRKQLESAESQQRVKLDLIAMILDGDITVCTTFKSGNALGLNVVIEKGGNQNE